MEGIARLLLETDSIVIDLARSFRLVSGRLSPVYVDCRRLISFPQAREAVVAAFAELAEREIGLDQIDVIAGGETAGIPFAAFLAQRLGKPMIYVRKEPKGHGLGRPAGRGQPGEGAQIEGVLEPGQRVLLVEDLVTDGGSKLRFVEGLERAGGLVRDCLTVFEYFSERAGLRRAREALSARGLRLHSLTNWDEVLELAAGRFAPAELEQVLAFLRELEF
ncbi:MAG: orotate phosphoribosyltransferase [Candidatus Acetothermia bacterium]|jgi:orotate phosphoribosyltransferase|nr:orotate phosphoribosyltransferase [Candidatus Acetothermia bacterium]MDH7505767.1 orotate phosphoribosyltransferase [Candidatus Acetothermia bacterium]